jgi:hypothetical protein
VPVGKWFQDGAFQAQAGSAGVIDPGFVAARLSAHRQGRSDERAFLWNAWILDRWAETRKPV